MALVLPMAKSTVAKTMNESNNLYLAKEAAEYLQIPLKDFLDFKSDISYIVILNQKLYKKETLDSFRKEVLELKKKL